MISVDLTHLPESADGVYILVGDDERVLYVGKSSSPVQRVRSHRSQSYWSLVRRVEWTACGDSISARILERDLIAKHQPPFNVVDRLVIPTPRVPLAAGLEAQVTALFRAGDDERLNAYLHLLNTNGWTMAALGYPLGYTREAIRLRIAKANPSLATGLPFELPPRKVTPQPKPKMYRRLRVKPAVAAELRALQDVAFRATGGTAVDDPRREASIELARALNALHVQGVGLRDLADACGVTRAAIRSRLGRHGYMPLPPSQQDKLYRGVRSTQSSVKDACKRGHPLSGDNLRLVNGDPARRQCRECCRIRSAAYKGRKRAARQAREQVAA